MMIAVRRGWHARAGRSTGVMLTGYGLTRYLVEFVREPDTHLGLLVGGLTMGQLLCLPMIAAGLYLLQFGRNQRQV